MSTVWFVLSQYVLAIGLSIITFLSVHLLASTIDNVMHDGTLCSGHQSARPLTLQ